MSKTTKREERGVAMLMAVFALLMVTSIAIGMMFLTDTETSVNSNFRDEQSAYYAARAGIEEARDRMRTLATSSISSSLPSLTPGSASSGTPTKYGVVYILNPTGSETVAPWSSSNSYYDDEICKEVGCSGGTVPPAVGWYTSTTASSTYAASPTLAYKWMRITLKTDGLASGWSGGTQNYYYVDGNAANSGNYVCWNGNNETVSATACTLPVYTVTSLAVMPSGARRIVQYEVTNKSLLALPGALTIDGTIGSGANDNICNSGSTCNSGGDYITGNEPSGCNSTVTVPAIATADSTSNSNLTTDVNANKANIVGPGGSPSVVNESTALADLNTVAELEAFVAQMKTLAGTNVGSDCTKLNLGTAASPTIAVVTNDPTVSGASSCNLTSGVTGYGILVVTGTLQYVNVNSYQGIVYVIGTGQFISSSSKDTTLTGALFIAQDRNPSTGALLSSLGAPTFNFHHGSASSSDASIQYNQCVINAVSVLGPSEYQTIAQRELMY